MKILLVSLVLRHKSMPVRIWRFRWFFGFKNMDPRQLVGRVLGLARNGATFAPRLSLPLGQILL